MNKINNVDMDNFYEIIHLRAKSKNRKEQDTIAKAVINMLPNDCEVTKFKGGYMVTVGESEFYPCLIAHLDQVHDTSGKFNVYECDNVVLATNGKRQIGIGGDDKCGLFAMTEVARNTPCKLLLVYDEEIGCKGSDMINPNHTFFDDISLLIGIDRHGNSDLITDTNGIQVADEDMVEEINDICDEYGYSEAYGTFSDVGCVAELTNIAGFNVSCGYYNEHTKHETINIKDMVNAINFINAIIERLNIQKWELPESLYGERWNKKDDDWVNGGANHDDTWYSQDYFLDSKGNKYYYVDEDEERCADCDSTLDGYGRCPLCSPAMVLKALK